MPEQLVIPITEPTSIRGYVSGGKGGYGYKTTELHRLVERRAVGDYAACGAFFMGKVDVKPAGRDGLPTKAQVDKYGLCPRCW